MLKQIFYEKLTQAEYTATHRPCRELQLNGGKLHHSYQNRQKRLPTAIHPCNKKRISNQQLNSRHRQTSIANNVLTNHKGFWVRLRTTTNKSSFTLKRIKEIIYPQCLDIFHIIIRALDCKEAKYQIYTPTAENHAFVL